MRPEKQLLLDEIQGQIEGHDAFVIMNYTGLDANMVNQFRCQIAESGGEVEMVRKRILVKAASAAGIELDLEQLPGHVSLVFGGKDAVQTTKTVFQLKKETGKSVNVIGGHFEGKFYNSEEVETLSKLPGKNEMRAQLLSVFEAPQQQTVAIMDSLLCSILYCMENKSKEESSN